jgi:hypothetical protein
MILECCGCERVFFRRDFWFSEWETMGQNPYTGEPQLEGGVEITYWPAPVTRKAPDWVESVERADPTLGKLLSEMYTALNNDLRVLAAIGARTAFDRSSALLGVSSTLRFAEKLDQLVTIGKIGQDERDTLDVWSMPAAQRHTGAGCRGRRNSTQWWKSSRRSFTAPSFWAMASKSSKPPCRAKPWHGWLDQHGRRLDWPIISTAGPELLGTLLDLGRTD